jgi:hypothetical protein
VKTGFAPAAREKWGTGEVGKWGSGEVGKQQQGTVAPPQGRKEKEGVANAHTISRPDGLAGAGRNDVALK